jgi:uncharacterized protein (TIGR03118 family)
MQRRILALNLCLGIALVLGAIPAAAQYQVKNLDSNQVGAAKHVDPLLVNGWGLARAATSPFWVSDQGTGWSTLYNGTGQIQSLKVLIPSAGAGPGSPTGIVFNGSSDFQIQGWSTFFIFATLDGTISGWAPQLNPNQTEIQAHNPDAVYTGLAITSRSSGNRLFAADIVGNKIDVYDASFALVKSFTDPAVPAGFSTFGVQDINGIVYVTFTELAGGKGGFVDTFDEDGNLLKQLIKGAPLNQPWGITIAPPNFGPLSNSLLVTNKVDNGTINAFNPLTGQFVGTMKDTNGKAVHIDRLWGIEFGGGSANNGRKNQLFFTAGPSDELTGTFGVISLP